MANPFNGSKRGLRGGNANRPSRKEWEERSVVTTSQRVFEDRIFLEMGPGEEDPNPLEGVDLTRKSLTQQQHLKLFPQQVEYEDLRQRDRVSGELVKVGQRVVWKSDRSLLRQGNPFKFRHEEIKRVTSRTKRIVPDREIEIVNPDELRGNLNTNRK